MHQFISVSILAILACTSCTNFHNKGQEKKRFTYLNPEESGIDFRNDLTESDSINYFTWPYIYMGGGVAVGDINNDGFQDIYLTGNMVPNKLYLNKGNMKFEDISGSAGVAGDSRWFTGVTMIDINADGYLDIYVSVSGLGEMRENLLFINNGDLTFSEQASNYGIDDRGHSTNATFFDYDLDGDLDLYVCNYPETKFTVPAVYYRYKMDSIVMEESDHLYRNNGDGTFTNVTKEAGMMTFGLGLSAVAGDFNEDGMPDLYVSNDFASPDFFYFNNGDGTFTDKLKETVKHTSFYGMGADVADFNNDGKLDLIQLDMTPEDHYRSKANMATMDPKGFWQVVDLGFHYQYLHNTLQLNRGISPEGYPVFSQISRLAGVATTDWSWAALFFDMDNDGWKDLFVTNGTRREVNNRDYFQYLQFMVSKSFFDKKLDLLEASRNIPSEPINNYTLRNNGDLTFENVSSEFGLDFIGFSNGAAYADLDNDGDLDLVVSNIDSTAAVYKNNTTEELKNNYVRIKLEGPPNNPNGIGTRVDLIHGQSSQTFELTLARGFQSSVEPFIHFGLGKNKRVNEVQIRWPDGKIQRMEDIPVNQTLEVDYIDAKADSRKQNRDIDPIFKDYSRKSGLNFTHKENEYDDYLYQPSLPYKLSQLGPALAVGDINQDGFDDLYVGGASGQQGRMFIQNEDGRFEEIEYHLFENDKTFEDVDAVFFDADNDGDPDLYVVSGGNEFVEGSEFFKDRLYLNQGCNFVKAENVFSELMISGSCVRPADFDGDGDLDLFVGGRHVPRNYPLPARSALLRNDTENGLIKFTDVTSEVASDLIKPGMVTDAIWTDWDLDNDQDLILVGEWMAITFLENQGGTFVKVNDKAGLEKTEGWWFSIEQGDFDNDGDNDYIVGNLGLNYKYKASEERSFDVYASDYDNNGRLDIVLSYYQEDTQYPIFGREYSSEQIPGIKDKFEDNHSFASATLEEIYTQKALSNSLHYQAWNFASCYIENLGNGKFSIKPLPVEAQFSNINDIIAKDVNNDKNVDIIIVGNLYTAEIQTPRNDASYGLVLLGDGSGNFNTLSFEESGFYTPYDTKSMKKAGSPSGWMIVVGNNNEHLQIFRQTDEKDIKTYAAN